MSPIEKASAACWAGIQSKGFCFSGNSDSLPPSFLLTRVWILTRSWWYWSVCLWHSLLISAFEFLKSELLSPAGWNFQMVASRLARFELSLGTQFYFILFLFFYFISGSWVALNFIYHCPWVYIYSNLGTFLISHKFDGKIHDLKFCQMRGLFLTNLFMATPKWGCTAVTIQCQANHLSAKCSFFSLFFS